MFYFFQSKHNDPPILHFTNAKAILFYNPLSLHPSPAEKQHYRNKFGYFVCDGHTNLVTLPWVTGGDPVGGQPLPPWRRAGKQPAFGELISGGKTDILAGIWLPLRMLGSHFYRGR